MNNINNCSKILKVLKERLDQLIENGKPIEPRGWHSDGLYAPRPNEPKQFVKKNSR